MVQSTATNSSAPPVVVAQRLSKVFKDFWMRDQVRAVDGLDLEIPSGCIFGLIGPNGSGKSTTIKMILGLLHKTTGRLAVLGKPPTDIAVKRRIGFLPEESYLYPFLNARETLEFYGKLFGLPGRVRHRRIDELLEMTGLAAAQHRPIGQFSKGMQRRIGIAQALINDPEFLILDEPTSGLDPIGIRQVKDLILDLGRRGKTILLSSHLLSEVEDVCDSMAVLYGGRKRAEGTRDSLLAANDRTLIEVGGLDPVEARKVVDVIERFIGRPVTSVEPARESLESLFMKIVEKAQAERVATHGATRGGPTAAFLRGVEAEAAQGEQLIARLSAPETERGSVGPASDAPTPRNAGEDGPDVSMLERLVGKVGDRNQPKPSASAPPHRRGDRAPASTSTPAKPPADLEQSVIDSLLAPESDDEGQGRRP